MDSNGQTSSGDQFDAKGAFRRLSTDTTNRKYRRRSPVGGSASADGSPVRSRSSSPIQRRKNPEKTVDDHRKPDDERDSGRDWRQQARSGESRKHSDKQSSRSSHRHLEHDDYSRPDKNEDNDDRYYSKSSSHSLRDSRDKHYSDHSRRDNDHRSRDYARHVDRHYRDKYDNLAYRSRDKEREASYPESRKHKNRDTLSDRIGSGRMHTAQERGRYKEYRENQDEKTDHRMDFGDHKRYAYEESRGCHDESISTDTRELGVEKYIKEDKKGFDARNNLKEQYAKRSKFDTIDGETNLGKDVLKATTFADEKQSSTSKHDEVTLEQGVKDSDIDAAKVAAMKAAELVNRNLIGTGYMTADQKKKLLWGSKKNTTNSEESAHCWDTSTFGDCERQEKFNKLMSLRLHWYLWQIVGCEGQYEDGEQTWNPRCREAEGAADGLGEAVHCWTSSKRWSYCWIRPLRICFDHLSIHITVMNTLCTILTSMMFHAVLDRGMSDILRFQCQIDGTTVGYVSFPFVICGLISSTAMGSVCMVLCRHESSTHYSQLPSSF
ncbi:arginine/serine-rich coiled-coil protein 2-like isoform X2 [Ipomoea triloba]|nr:arginine/serine-rich coiled-coil protein 2-like isoform X2 [Ipomoea triloba]XP_031129171.1 arginine/serine-rich coiled-coil protein 2-like isoform X2 [Ipomoea triloba]